MGWRRSSQLARFTSRYRSIPANHTEPIARLPSPSGGSQNGTWERPGLEVDDYRQASTGQWLSRKYRTVGDRDRADDRQAEAVVAVGAAPRRGR